MHKTLKNKYQILNKSYHSLLGDIYDCHDNEDPQNQKIVKVISKKLNQKKTFCIDNIKKLIENEHDHIIKIYDCFQQDDVSTQISTQQYLNENCHNNIYIILEKINQRSIGQYIGTYGPEQIEVIYQNVKSTMQYLHSLDIDQYRISNQSIIIDEHENIKIVDLMFQSLVTSEFSELKQKQEEKQITRQHQLNQLQISVSKGNDIYQQNLWNFGILLLSFISGRKIAKSEQQNFLEEKHLNQFLKQLADNTILFHRAIKHLLRSKSDERELINLKNNKQVRKQFKLKRKQAIIIIIMFILAIGFTIYAITHFGVSRKEKFYKKGYQKFIAGAYTQAEYNLNQAIKIDPEYVEAYFYRAKTKQKLKKYDQALEDYTELIKLQPERGELYYNRGKIYDKLAKFEQAFIDFQKAAELQQKQQYHLRKQSLSKQLKKNENNVIHTGILKF